jgi:hypothetical protein
LPCVLRFTCNMVLTPSNSCRYGKVSVYSIS